MMIGGFVGAVIGEKYRRGNKKRQRQKRGRELIFNHEKNKKSKPKLY